MSAGTDLTLEWSLGPDDETGRYPVAQTLKLTMHVARPLTGAQVAALGDVVHRLGIWAAATSMAREVTA